MLINLLLGVKVESNHACLDPCGCLKEKKEKEKIDVDKLATWSESGKQSCLP